MQILKFRTIVFEITKCGFRNVRKFRKSNFAKSKFETEIIYSKIRRKKNQSRAANKCGVPNSSAMFLDRPEITVGKWLCWMSWVEENLATHTKTHWENFRNCNHNCMAVTLDNGARLAMIAMQKIRSFTVLIVGVGEGQSPCSCGVSASILPPSTDWMRWYGASVASVFGRLDRSIDRTPGARARAFAIDLQRQTAHKFFFFA